MYIDHRGFSKVHEICHYEQYSERLVWLGWCRGKPPASVVTYDEFDGERIPPGDVIVREDVLGHFGHVLRVLLPQDLHPFLVAIYTCTCTCMYI